MGEETTSDDDNEKRIPQEKSNETPEKKSKRSPSPQPISCSKKKQKTDGKKLKDLEGKGKFEKEEGKGKFEKEDFLACKKFKGSKNGYVFRMGTQGLGYYIDEKPVVDKMAMAAILRMGQNRGRQSSG